MTLTNHDVEEAVITVVNTKFTNHAGEHPFYEYDVHSNSATHGVTPANCVADPCSSPPFTGDCFPSASPNQGVICDPPACPVGSYTQVFFTSLPPPLALPCGETMPEFSCSKLDLSVTGREGKHTMLMAASETRHFKITSGAHTLRLKWLNLTGADVSVRL
eukprot:g3630.t1